MANGQGGYRQPANPAPVSGPGALSQRTDGGPADPQPARRLPNAGYGESAQFEAQQAAAPMAGGPAPIDSSGLVPLESPTENPLEDVTAGAVVPGEPETPGEFDIMRLRSWFPALKRLASASDVSPATRQLIRQLEANF